jgi:hypothetical protein
MELDVLLWRSEKKRKRLNVPEWRNMEHLQRELTLRYGQLDVNPQKESRRIGDMLQRLARRWFDC